LQIAIPDHIHPGRCRIPLLESPKVSKVLAEVSRAESLHL
jgi:hypothetical protein